MWFLFTLSLFSMFFQICFVTLAIASGLYYLAEMVEEYTVTTGKVIRILILANLVIQLGLFIFEPFPFPMLVCNVVHQLANLMILRTFPFFVILSPAFITSIVSLVVNHYLAFQYFGQHYCPFTEVLAYFTLCLWIIPFAFFVSLTANENMLPTTLAEDRPLLGEHSDVVSHYFSRKTKKSGLLSFFHTAGETIWPQRSKKAF